jgi:hypothetical protein
MWQIDTGELPTNQQVAMVSHLQREREREREKRKRGREGGREEGGEKRWLSLIQNLSKMLGDHKCFGFQNFFPDFGIYAYA